MSAYRLILASLRYHWRIHLAVALGVAVCTAVLTGALLVGDSMRGSLRQLVLDRLGRVDEVLLTRQFFRVKLAEELERRPGFDQHFSEAQPAILLIGTLENPDRGRARASQVTVLGTTPNFWSLGEGRPTRLPGSDEVVINRPLASELQAEVGDEVLIRLPQLGEIPPDSPLGRKTETLQSRRFQVIEIIEAHGLGSFGIRPNQQLSRNAYLSIDSVQRLLEQPNKANALLVAGKADLAPTPEGHEQLQAMLAPQLADYGLILTHVRAPEEGEPVLDYFNLTSSGMMLEETAEAAASRAFEALGAQPALTYLANEIAAGGRSIPYSTITGIENDSAFGPLFSADGIALDRLNDNELVLNSWAAEDLRAEIGDEIRITYFEPENTHGKVTEASATFRLKAIVPLAPVGERPQPANDPGLTPELPGVTDQESIDDWDPPFPYDDTRVREKDEQYWDDHRTTPKAFISLAAARKLWGSRFGQTTSIRIPNHAGTSVESLTAQLQDELQPAAFGFEFLPVKLQGLAASAGTTPFDALFLSFSFFIIAAAVMLVLLLFRLGVDQRASEVGLLLAVGVGRAKARRLLALEALFVAAVGSLLGVAGGVGYAWLMITGLRTWWRDAITTPFIEVHIHPITLILSYAIGLVISLLTVVWGLRQMKRTSARQLLAGESTVTSVAYRRGIVLPAIAVLLLIAAAGTGWLGLRQSGELQAAAFFASGALVLLSVLLMIWAQLRAGTLAAGRTVRGLAVRNGARNPSRSTLTIGLVAAASFLIVSISAFRLDPPTGEPQLASGEGGFALVAESSQPIYQDLNSPEGRADLGFGAESMAQLESARIYSLRVQSGDDASCLNLYQPTQPRVLGLPADFITRGGFQWASSLADTAETEWNPWLLLNGPMLDGAPTPVVLDQSTAAYSMKVGLGDEFEIKDARGKPVRLRLVGLLKNSLLQGSVLMSEQSLLQHFPDVNGYRFFLIEAPLEQAPAISQALEGALSDYGFDVELARTRLAGFMAVQNTYLSTFQSLGGLGLLLGTIGLAVVQLRSVIERRRELALMRAAGFRKTRLAQMVLLENSMLLLFGLGTGVIAAAVAILPHLFGGEAGIPYRSLAITLGLVVVVGIIAGLAAVRVVLRAPLVTTLRGE